MKWWLTCIRKYVTFEGRARRKEYWMFTLFNVVFVVVTMLLDILLFGATPDNPTSPRYLTTLYGLFVFLPTLTVVVRRLHDIGRSGWWLAGYYGVAFVCTILMIGSVLMLGGKGSGMALTGGRIRSADDHCRLDDRLMCFDSQAGENKYGPNPSRSPPGRIAAPAAAAELSEPETPEKRSNPDSVGSGSGGRRRGFDRAAIWQDWGRTHFSPACESKHIERIIQTAVIISTANPTPVNAIPLPPFRPASARCRSSSGSYRRTPRRSSRPATSRCTASGARRLSWPAAGVAIRLYVLMMIRRLTLLMLGEAFNEMALTGSVRVLPSG